MKPSWSGPSPGGGASWSRGTSSARKSRAMASASAWRAGLVEAADEAVGGKDGEAGVLQGDQAHQHIPVRSLAADLLRVGLCGLVTVMAVCDQQLGIAQRLLNGRDRLLLGDAPDSVDGAFGVRDLAVGGLLAGRRQCVPGGVGGIGVEREDRREVRLRGAHEA